MTVIQDWLGNLPWKMQTVVITGIRGCDGLTKYDASKHVSRAIRRVSLKNADRTTTYMQHDAQAELHEAVEKFVEDLDRYPVHYVLHVAHACEIIGYKHLDRNIAAMFLRAYSEIVQAMHMNPEEEASLDVRLADNREA